VQRMKLCLVILLCLCLPVTGCHTLRGVSLPEVVDAHSLENVNPGDDVVVTLKSGAKRAFRVTSVDTDALTGQEVRIPYTDIEALQVRRISVGRTSGVVLGTFLILAAVALLQLMAILGAYGD